MLLFSFAHEKLNCKEEEETCKRMSNLDISVDEQGVHFTVNILHCHLEAIETPRLCHLYFNREILNLQNVES